MMANTSKIVQLTQALNCRMVLTKYANLASSPLSLLTALTMWLSRQEKQLYGPTVPPGWLIFVVIQKSPLVRI